MSSRDQNSMVDDVFAHALNQFFIVTDDVQQISLPTTQYSVNIIWNREYTVDIS